jgi:hypothetical protein
LNNQLLLHSAIEKLHFFVIKLAGFAQVAENPQTQPLRSLVIEEMTFVELVMIVAPNCVIVIPI